MTSTNIQRILIIEDDPDYRWQLACSLEMVVPNCQTVTLLENQQVLSYLTHASIQLNLILWNVDMLLNNSFQIISEIKKNKSSQFIPIVALAEHCYEEWILQCYQVGIKAYVIKPHSKREMVALRQLIESFKVHHVDTTYTPVPFLLNQ